MRPVRTAAALAALMLVSAVAAPSVGAFDKISETGTTGFWTIPEANGSPGVKCKFENNAGKKHDEINAIKIDSHWSHGPYENRKTWIGSRFLILKDAKPFDGTYKRVHTSKVVKKKADDGASPVAMFDARTWKAPENAKARYRVRQVLFYYKKGSKTKVAGKVKGTYEIYRQRMNPKAPYDIGAEGGPTGYCQHNWNAPIL